MTTAEGEPLVRDPEARHRGRPAGMLAKKARGGSAGISAAAAGIVGGVASSIVSRGSASASVSLDPRPKSREERSDGHALQRERGAHLPGEGFSVDSSEREGKAIEAAFLVFRSLGRPRRLILARNPSQHCQPGTILLVLARATDKTCRASKRERKRDGEGAGERASPSVSVLRKKKSEHETSKVSTEAAKKKKLRSPLPRVTQRKIRFSFVQSSCTEKKTSASLFSCFTVWVQSNSTLEREVEKEMGREFQQARSRPRSRSKAKRRKSHSPPSPSSRRRSFHRHPPPTQRTPSYTVEERVAEKEEGLG